ncbi:MAG: N-acetyl-gamma-glutamyl-phosphate reductase [Desulfuromonadaceae bacterium]|nr:N-acetyl-gamma-glutamyl-phosphate reductase [Desulfuromonas sp.]MDY0184721.1 N-acetyl-gamma-glutamyl-phosphate reductase [Desulfuromonadaceae bacterium]
MLNVAVIGATGYTGVELVRLLLRHPQVNIVALTSRQYANESFAQIFPSMVGHLDTVCTKFDAAELVDRKVDIAFTAVPHKTAMEVVPSLLERNIRVVDLSADYRLRDVGVYEQWYQTHTSPDLVNSAVYGLPELYRSKIGAADLVANPGCYPTSIAVAMAPLVLEKLIELDGIVLDSKSGATGAGRSAKTSSLFCEVNEGFKAYAVTTHRHTPEIEQTMNELSGALVKVNFTPHLLPLNRGILSTCYATLKPGVTQSQVDAAFETCYASEPFVRLCHGGNLPNTAYVRGSNFVDLGWVVDHRTGRIIVVSAIDNLVKGAAGQAVQNMNIMFGLVESEGLTVVPLFP